MYGCFVNKASTKTRNDSRFDEPMEDSKDARLPVTSSAAVTPTVTASRSSTASKVNSFFSASKAFCHARNIRKIENDSPRPMATA